MPSAIEEQIIAWKAAFISSENLQYLSWEQFKLITCLKMERDNFAASLEERHKEIKELKQLLIKSQQKMPIKSIAKMDIDFSKIAIVGPFEEGDYITAHYNVYFNGGHSISIREYSLEGYPREEFIKKWKEAINN
jgi:hypothetical protein